MKIKIDKRSGAVLRTKNKYCNEDISIVLDSELFPAGKINISDTKEVDVTKYSSAQVVDENLKAENIAEGVEVLGVTGTLKATGGSTLKNLLDYTRSCARMFYGNGEIIDLTGYLEYGDTENVTSMSNMFYECRSLTTVPRLDASNVTDMIYMFYGCNNLTTLQLDNTSKVAFMNSMFYYCPKLQTIPQLDTSSATDMTNMFSNCYKLEKIDITHYNLTSAVNSQYMCSECYSLKSLIIRGFGNNYSLNSTSFRNCFHILGTTDSAYNPTGAKDGYIYVPKNMVDTLKSATNWSTYADQIKPIFTTECWGNGVISETINNNNETILNAVSNSGGSFKGWYKGTINKTYEYSTTKTSYEAPQITYPFQLNGDGYYQNTNQNQGDSSSKGRFNFNITNEDQKIRITYLQSSEMGYDYGVIGNIDEVLSNDTNTSGYKTLQNISNTTPQEVIIDNIGIGSHFIEIKYRKDASVDSGTDTLQVKVEVMNAKIIRTLNIDESPYSTEPEVNIGVINEMTIEPLSLVAVFESDYEQPTQNGDELLVTQVYRSEQNENILEVE